jgi:signal transduction histidine kinase
MQYKTRVIFAFFLYLISVIIFEFVDYNSYKKEIFYAKIDQKLKIASIGAKFIIGDDFHKNIDKNISHQDYLSTIHKLSEYAKSVNIRYIYSMIKKDDKIYFTSSSATDEEFKSGDFTLFMDEYTDATDLNREMFNKRNFYFEESSDKWGNFRSILMPFQIGNIVYVIGADVEIDSINEALNQRLMHYFFEVIFFILISIPIFLVLFLHIRDNNKYLQTLVDEKVKELNEINIHLEDKIQDAISEIENKNQLLIKQSRHAAMGEMISNIAHQWRQPLNALGLLVQDLREAYYYQELDDDYLDNSIAKATNLLSYMSNTIDDFRNFFKADKQKNIFSIQESINESLAIVSSALQNNGINVALIYKENFMIDGYKREFSQAILNIVNNAKDVLIERSIEHPKIIIRIEKIKEKLVISIEDNGKGINTEIIEKIFEPYFTTKDDTKGTGIGLYMTKTIIEKNMGGKLMVKNTDMGAKFIIEFDYAEV